MDHLEDLPPVTQLSERVIRILGQNPGKMTLQGTNTYLLGIKPPFILLDTGDGAEAYIPYLRSALEPFTKDGISTNGLVSDIVLSHEHKDHWGGLASVLSLLSTLSRESGIFTPPKVHKYPHPTPALSTHLSRIPPTSYTPYNGDTPLHELTDLQTFHAPSATLTVLHVSGHTLDSICVLLHEEQILFTADTVLGVGSAVFSDLGQYMTSLKRLLSFASASESENETRPIKYTTIYPGHGPVVQDGPAKVQEYITHRLERELEIIAAMQLPSSNIDIQDGWTPMELVANIYAQIPKGYWSYAAHSVTLHLEKLEKDGRAVCVPRSRDAGDGEKAWKLVDSPSAK